MLANFDANGSVAAYLRGSDSLLEDPLADPDALELVDPRDPGGNTPLSVNRLKTKFW